MQRANQKSSSIAGWISCDMMLLSIRVRILTVVGHILIAQLNDKCRLVLRLLAYSF